MPLRLALCCLTVLLASCGGGAIPGLGPDPKAVQREADSKAIGGACRYALRGIEDCYTLNPKAIKSHVFTGWKDMDAYMRENKIDGVASTAKPLPEEGAEPADKPAEKTADAKSDKKAEPKADAKTDSKAKPKAEAAAPAH
jgi:hypothetical protein